MAAADYNDRLDAIGEKEGTPPEAIRLYKELVLKDASTAADAIKAKETAIAKVAELYVKLKDAGALRAFLTELRPQFNAFSKAKTAKIVRSIIDSIAKVPDSVALQVGSP